MNARHRSDMADGDTSAVRRRAWAAAALSTGLHGGDAPRFGKGVEDARAVQVQP
jgi:hypothetical protein